jgi:TonB family protein
LLFGETKLVSIPWVQPGFEVEEAKSLAALGEYAKAEELLSHALVVLRQAPEIDDASRAIALANLSEVLAKQNKTGDALSSLAKALPELERTLGLHEQWLLAANNYEQLLRGNGRNSEALKLTERIAKARSESAYVESKSFVRPRLKSPASPTYPSEAKRLPVSGTVLLFIEISRSGQVDNVNVIQPLGLGLDDEATRAVRKWKFEPARNGSRTVPFFGQVELQFDDSKNLARRFSGLFALLPRTNGPRGRCGCNTPISETELAQ